MKKVSLLLVLVFAAMAISAQDSGFSTKVGRNATFARNGFWDNWFVGIGGGATMYLNDNANDAKFTNRLNLAPTVFVGKWYNPYFGARLKFNGGGYHTFNQGATVMNHPHYLGANVDLLFNVSNYLGHYNENRFYSFIPYVGIGFVHGFDEDWKSIKNNSATRNAGIINNFRLSNRASLFVEIAGNMVQESFDRMGGGDFEWDGMLSAFVGFNFKIGKKNDFSEALLMDQGLLDDLNGQINKLRQENEALKNRKVEAPKCPDCPKCPEVKPAEVKNFVSNVVFFRLGSAVIDKNQEVSIYNTAKYLQDNPSKNVKIVGYADKKTGTASINMKLSEKRAKNVANALINKYNINSNRVKVEWKGDTEQPYAENAWNRVAIFFAE